MAKRRISIRKILQTLVTMIAVGGCAVAMISADRRQADRKITAVDIRVESPAGVRFVTEEAVRERLFRNRHLKPEQLRSGTLDVRKMEAILDANPWVDEAEVYADANRVLRIKVRQRVPAVRIFEESGNSYYLDAASGSMPLSPQYTHYAPVVTGVRKLRDDSAGRVLKGTILGLVRRVNAQPFWASQISQIDMRADGGFEIVPVIGDQRIIIGDTDLLDDKLANLMAFYQQVQNRVGWDKYRTIDLRYKDQVVASPGLRWKAPVDRAISTMNWLTAIMDNTAAKEPMAGGDGAAKNDGVEQPVTTAAPVPAAAAPKPAVPVTNPPAKVSTPAALPKPAAQLPKKPAASRPDDGKRTAGTAKAAQQPARTATAAKSDAKRSPAQPTGRTQLKPAAAAPKTPKPAPKVTPKTAPKPAAKDAKKAPVKNTSRQPQNSASHAATNR